MRCRRRVLAMSFSASVAISRLAASQPDERARRIDCARRDGCRRTRGPTKVLYRRPRARSSLPATWCHSEQGRGRSVRRSRSSGDGGIQRAHHRVIETR